MRAFFMRTLIVSSVFSCLLPAICLGQLGEPNCITSRIAEVPIEGGGTVCWYQYEQCNGTATSIIAGDCSAAVCRCMGSICACPDHSAFTPGPPAHFVDEAASPMAAVPAGDTWRTVSATNMQPPGGPAAPQSITINRPKKIKTNGKLSGYAGKLQVSLAASANPAGWSKTNVPVTLVGYAKNMKNGQARYFALYEITLTNGDKHYFGIRVAGTPDATQKIFICNNLLYINNPGGSTPSNIEAVLRAPGPEATNNGSQFRKYYHILGIDI